MPLLTALCSAAQEPVTEPITVAWRSKPPYHYSENGIDKGFLLERAKAIFKTAGLPATFVEEPSRRIWANFTAGKKNYCSIGWYRLPEREKLAQYSIAFHRDLPHTVLVAPEKRAQVMTHPTLTSLLADTTLTMGVVDGVSYGALLDDLIKASRNRVDIKMVDPAVLTRSVAAGRVDFIFIDREDLAFVRQRYPAMRNVPNLDFPDMAPGLPRFITCSKDVPSAQMARINRAIDLTLKQKPSQP